MRSKTFTSTIAIAVTAVLLTGCVEQTAPATDCVKVANWVELGLTAEVLIKDPSQDEAYNKIIAEKNSAGGAMSDHERRFGETLVNQLKTRAVAPYADIYGLCRKWETGNY